MYYTEITKIIEAGMKKDPTKVLLHSPEVAKGLRCRNPRCICSVETGIEHVFVEHDGRFRCAYCEAEAE